MIRHERVRQARRAALLIASSIVVHANHATAWDSHDPSAAFTTHTPVMPQAPYPFTWLGFGIPNAIQDSGFLWQQVFKRDPSSPNYLYYAAHLTNANLGGVAGTPGPVDLAGGLFLCDEAPTNGVMPQNCRPASSTEGARWPWVNIRRAWNDPESAEHYQVTLAAARLAGLPSEFENPFWIRYPTDNVLISSPAPTDESPDGRIIGQSWIPRSLDQFGPGMTHVLRPISLYELAQAPDFSYSLWDWAAGDEVCPLVDIDGAFYPAGGNAEAEGGNLACHDYMRTVGVLNSTHFLPAARSVYEHYHQLAIDQMLKCRALDQALAPAYAAITDQSIFGDPLRADLRPEIRDCEMEGLAYEMFADHFLEDAWSTGHMWQPWGKPELASYPFSLAPSHGITWDRNDPPVENVPGRRALIAAIAGAFRGMVHGDKAILKAKLHESDAYKQVAQDFPLLSKIEDDPLCGPVYLDPLPVPPFAISRNVEWSAKQDTKARGAGDLFLSTVLNPSVSDYDLQRQRLLSCVALSLQTVYATGPETRGMPRAIVSVPDDFDFGRDCWSQLATNASMNAAASPVPLVFESPANMAIGSLFAVVNKAVVQNAGPKVQLPNGDDGSAFLASLEKRMTFDALEMYSEYSFNRHLGGRDGTDSARGVSVRTDDDGQVQLSFLGLGPNSPLDEDPPVYYQDVGQPMLPETAAPEDYFVHNLFWRGHIDDLCSDEDLVARLHDQCVAGASLPGGDPDACTFCAMVAEMHMPTCGSEGISKCGALGQTHGGGLPPDLLVYDPASPLNPDCTGYAPYYRAFHYCTETLPNSGKPDMASAASLPSSKTELNSYNCDPVLGLPSHFYDSQYRLSILWDEHLADQTGVTSLMGPFATVYNDHTVAHLLDPGKYCDFHSGYTLDSPSLDPVRAAAVEPLPLFATSDHTVAAAEEGALEDATIDQLAVGRCQEVQRTFIFNKTCADALPALLSDPTDLALALARDGQPYDPALDIYVLSSEATGPPYITDPEPRCSYREPPSFVPTCVQGSCSASGLCSSAGVPQVLAWHDQP